MPEFIDLVLAKTSRKRSFSMTKNERFGLVFAKPGSANSGTGSGSNCALCNWLIVVEKVKNLVISNRIDREFLCLLNMLFFCFKKQISVSTQ